MEREAAIELAELVGSVLRDAGVRRCELSGSLRRGLSWVGDADLVAVADEGFEGVPLFSAASQLRGRSVRQDICPSYQGGGDILRVWIDDFKIDVRFTTAEVFGATQLWLTGNRDFGRSLEAIAVKNGWRFTPDGVFMCDGELAIGSADERSVLAALAEGLWIEPEHRTCALDLISDDYKVCA